MHALIGNGADHVDHHVLVDGHPTCACGQELDRCRGAHCPRCGHRLPELVGSASAGRTG